MKIKDHRQMMRSLTDPLNIPKLRALLEAHPVLTQEEFRTRQNMAKGGTPQLVQPGPGRPGYAGRYTDPNYSKKYYKKNKPALKKAASEWYEKNKARVADYPLLDREATKIEKGPRKGQYRYSLAGKKDPITGERVGETYYFKSKEKLQEFKKKRYETEKLSKQKQAKVIGKELEVIDNHTQTWLDNYVKKNLKNYELGDFNTFKKDLAKDFAKEVKNKKYQLSEKSKNTWIGKTASANKRTTLENLPHIQQFQNVDLVSPYYHTLFYDNYLKQNPKFAKEVGSYMNWVVDPANKVKGRQALLMDARNKFSDDVIKFFGEIQPGSQAVTQNVLAKNFPKQYRQFIVNNKRFYSEYKAISNKVEKLAGIPENSILNQMTRDSRNLRKLYNVEKLPIHLKYSTDHLISLAHAARLNDPVIARQAVKNIVGKTYKENINAGLKGYQGVKGNLISQFVKTKNVDKKKEIINRLNELVTEYDPGTLEYKYSPKSKSGMKINVLTKPQVTREARFEGWKKSLPKKHQSLIEKIGCPGLAAGGRASFKDGSTCYTRGMDKIQTGKITTPGERANFTKLAQTLGPDGWKFVGIDYDAAVKMKGPVASILRSAAKAAPKTSGALAATGRFLFHPVEMGLLPLALVAEGLYANYADKRDLQKVLDEIPLSGEYGMPQYKKDLIMEGYIQQARDKGGVGLETYAIDQPNISGALEKIGFGDPNFLAQTAGQAIAGKREEERRAYEAERERQKGIFDIDAPMMAKGGRVSYLDGGIVSLLKK